MEKGQPTYGKFHMFFADHFWKLPLVVSDWYLGHKYCTHFNLCRQFNVGNCVKYLIMFPHLDYTVESTVDYTYSLIEIVDNNYAK